MLKSLKYGRHLPLFKDLSKSSHNHACGAARIALIVAAAECDSPHAGLCEAIPYWRA